jgi:malonate-semialdehyde dehydrogenase (acetylating)/methylmalonate-semialdehyde dehydrogenase
VFDPNQGKVQAKVRFGTADDLQRAVDAANAALPGWAATNPQRRARVMFKFKELVEKNMDELARLLSSEHGKVIADSKGDVQRGLEVIEFACGIPHALKGEYTQGAGPGIDVYSMRQPLGIGAGITPFNFPAMIPMWMFGVAIACGNAFILKPSERDPSVPIRLAELMKEAGLPDGILNVVHGDKEMVDAILDHEDIKAISFVGSSDIAQYIYARGTSNGKRVQAFGGAKNHGIVMPDADLDQVVNDLTGAAFGSAGERCMAPGRRSGRRQDRRCSARKADSGDRGSARRRLDRRRGALRPGRHAAAQATDRAIYPDVRRRRRRTGRRRPRLQASGT